MTELILNYAECIISIFQQDVQQLDFGPVPAVTAQLQHLAGMVKFSDQL
jgi:hypothetical protein